MPDGLPLTTVPGEDESRPAYRVQTPATRTRKGPILVIGDDPMLSYTRKLLLGHAGYAVLVQRTTDNLADADPANLQLILICRSVSPPAAGRLAARIHAMAPDTPILRFAHLEEEGAFGPVSYYSGIVTPGGLLAAVDRLVGAKQR